MAKKLYNQLTFKERLIHRLHDDLAFNCNEKLTEEDAFYTCKNCARRANIILMHFTFEIDKIRQEKV